LRLIGARSDPRAFSFLAFAAARLRDFVALRWRRAMAVSDDHFG
jgi:hypothetical protein